MADLTQEQILIMGREHGPKVLDVLDYTNGTANPDVRVIGVAIGSALGSFMYLMKPEQKTALARFFASQLFTIADVPLIVVDKQ